ncbi:hypothetical protein DM01DRAFT_1050210 [Hesseltinella vesiculosa]|uniref:Uncharacterized protein n=1 Tax=Hesseltinella vesiculosa TaxID=101127 RepID=A0A1X2GG68_9FUNG|nr:hypothetical protein DM01DRAFT_1050210 [Hesseltinella vesiculosa]
MGRKLEKKRIQKLKNDFIGQSHAECNFGSVNFLVVFLQKLAQSTKVQMQPKLATLQSHPLPIPSKPAVEAPTPLTHPRPVRMWTLTSGKVVEDQIFQLGIECEWEHHAHGFIIAPDDPVWKKKFTTDELEEIASTHAHPLPPCSHTLLTYLK